MFPSICILWMSQDVEHLGRARRDKQHTDHMQPSHQCACSEGNVTWCTRGTWGSPCHFQLLVQPSLKWSLACYPVNIKGWVTVEFLCFCCLETHQCTQDATWLYLHVVGRCVKSSLLFHFWIFHVVRPEQCRLPVSHCSCAWKSCVSVFHLWSVEHIVATLDICIHWGHHCDSFTVGIRQWYAIITGGQITCVWHVVQLLSSTVAITEKTFSSTLGNIRAVSMGNPVIQRQSGDPDKWDDDDCCTNEQEIEFSPRLSLHPPDKTVLKCYNK